MQAFVGSTTETAAHRSGFWGIVCGGSAGPKFCVFLENVTLAFSVCGSGFQGFLAAM